MHFKWNPLYTAYRRTVSEVGVFKATFGNPSPRPPIPSGTGRNRSKSPGIHCRTRQIYGGQLWSVYQAFHGFGHNPGYGI